MTLVTQLQHTTIRPETPLKLENKYIDLKLSEYDQQGPLRSFMNPNPTQLLHRYITQLKIHVVSVVGQEQ